MNVPFLDLKAQLTPIRAEIDAAMAEVLDACAFAGGPFVSRFEQDFAAFTGTAHSIAVGNGTDALWFALLALGIGPGDDVITSPSTFMATAEAISYAGANPVFADIDESTYTIDPSRLERVCTPRTKAIIPVHLFGQPADMDPILKFAESRGLAVIEDACQAHGARYKGRPAGSLGHVGCFSFYPGKNLGALGEGGGVTTNDPNLAERIRVFRDHGQVKKYHHSCIGWNGRMDGIQGAALRVKLRYLTEWNDRRRAHANHYTRLLSGIDALTLPVQASYAHHVYHIYAIRVARRDDVLAELSRRGITCGIHYPLPIHLQEAYRELGKGRGSFPIAEACADEFLSLPMYPELTPNQVEYVAHSVREVVTRERRPALVPAA